MPPHFAALAVLLTLLLAAPPARAAERYPIDGGTYEARPPAGWDGRGPLPLLVFFHGYGQQGSAVMTLGELTAAADRHGVLIVAPDGLEGSWAHQGSPSARRDENAFIDRLLADVARRWPIDPDRRWAAGFSQGGSMAWHAACFRGDAFAAFAPVAGAFWRPQPDDCPAGPVDMLHTHGTADSVVPMTGRAIGQAFHQGDVRAGIALWRREDGCAVAPTRIETVAGLACEIWSHCGSGHEVRLCLHPGGHMIPKGWAETALTWAEGISLQRHARAAP